MNAVDPTLNDAWMRQQTECLAALEIVSKELTLCQEAFWARRGEFPLGYPAEALAVFLKELAAFSQRFAAFEPIARTLEGAQLFAVARYISLRRAEIQRTTSIIQEMHDDRVRSDAEGLGVATKTADCILDVLDTMNRSLLQVLRIDKRGQ